LSHKPGLSLSGLVCLLPFFGPPRKFQSLAAPFPPPFSLFLEPEDNEARLSSPTLSPTFANGPESTLRSDLSLASVPGLVCFFFPLPTFGPVFAKKPPVPVVRRELQLCTTAKRRSYPYLVHMELDGPFVVFLHHPPLFQTSSPLIPFIGVFLYPGRGQAG